MDFITRTLALVSAAFLVVGVGNRGGVENASTTTTSTSAVTATGSSPLPVYRPAPTTTTTYAIPSTARCGQWWGLAIELGWQKQDLDTLDYIMWRESRCDPSQHNTKLNKDGSTDIGLTQINDRSWCLPTRWYPNGYLQSVGVLSSLGCDELFDPATNLKAAKAIYDYSRQNEGRGFEAWEL
jgi:hypothetical protein